MSNFCSNCIDIIQGYNQCNSLELNEKLFGTDKETLGSIQK